jgi:Fe-S-cluster-containing hydrogenase component 2
MPMKIIIEECLACGACMMTCPQRAIEERSPTTGSYVYRVLAERCDECCEEEVTQCQGVCPVPECLVPIR